MQSYTGELIQQFRSMPVWQQETAAVRGYVHHVPQPSLKSVKAAHRNVSKPHVVLPKYRSNSIWLWRSSRVKFCCGTVFGSKSGVAMIH